MPLDTGTLQADLVAIFAGGQSGGKTQTQVAAELATAIETFVKSATVTGVCPPTGGPLGEGAIT